MEPQEHPPVHPPETPPFVVSPAEPVDEDERDRLIFRLLLLNKWFLIPTTVAYEWFLSISPFRSMVYQYITPTILYIAGSLVLIILLWITHQRAAEGNVDPSYTRATKVITILSYVMDVLYVFYFLFPRKGGNLLWILLLFPMSVPLLLPRMKHPVVWLVDGVSATVLFTVILGGLYAFEELASPRHFIQGDLLLCLSCLLFMWVSIRMSRTWIDTLNTSLQQSRNLITLWTEVLRHFPADYLLVNETGDVISASEHARKLLQLPKPGKNRWPESTEAIRNALLLRFHAETPILEPITIPDDTLPNPLKIHPNFFAFGKQRYCIALVQEESAALGARMGVLRSDRLAVAGQIAAGLAHELGNPLGVIQSCASYLRQKCEAKDPNLEEYELIEAESKRCQNLIDRLLSLASPKRDTPEKHDLREILQHAVSMVKYQAGTREIEIMLPPNRAPIFANEGQISAVFVNLFLNALQSMEASPPEARLRMHLKVRGAEAIVDVTDEGCGIDSEELSRIFDPFFTKKAEGTGLGLSIVHQIVTSLGGQIDVASRLNQGTTFTVRLPLLESEME